MNENRMQILQMLASGQITAEEAERLIAALGKESSSSTDTSSESGMKAKPKYIHILVEAQKQGDPDMPSKVNVRVPMQLLRAGVKLVNVIPVQAREEVNIALREKGIQFDLNQIKPENLEEIVDQLGDMTVDVDDKNAKVRVFCE